MTRTTVALIRISRNPEGRMKFTGKFDANGDPIMRSDGQKLLPGQVFQIDDEAEYRHLLGLDAVRELNEQELALWEANPAALKFDPVEERYRAAVRANPALDERFPQPNH